MSDLQIEEWKKETLKIMLDQLNQAKKGLLTYLYIGGRSSATATHGCFDSMPERIQEEITSIENFLNTFKG